MTAAPPALAPKIRILTSSGGSHGRYKDSVLESTVAGSAVSARSTTEKGVVNPVYILSHGAVGPDRLFVRTSKRTIDTSGPVGDALRALHELGARHSVTAINLSNDRAHGTFEFDNSGLLTSGGPTTKQLGGADNVKRLVDAAWRVVDAAA